MAVYVRLVGATIEGTASIQGHIEQVYSPDDATAFTCGDALFFRQKAFENWSNLEWEIEKLADGKYRVKAST